ncbi:MAG: polysaccharide deacetylase family protein [Deltaproteobacteria bacterium]|nr:polysaccharide deacetylase family protein [Deltaproteobacteria bacterium]
MNADRGRERDGRITLFPLAPFHLVALALLQVAVVCGLWQLELAAIPLGILLGLAAAAPFFPRWRLFMPVIDRVAAAPGVALTFDDGPDPKSTPALLALLERWGIKAAFFVVGERAREHPELMRDILVRGHAVGNHGLRHDPWLALRSRARMRAEIEGCQQVVAAFGLRPLLFRPPAWVVAPGMWPVLLRLGMRCAAASCRDLSWGNRRVGGLARRLLRKARPGDILALHDRPAATPAETARWLAEIEALLVGLQARDLAVLPLGELLGHAVCERLDLGQPGPVRAFYDGLASRYDAEQETPGQRGLRRAERACVIGALDRLLGPGQRVLELGAGTGRFTLEIASRCERVLALDLSPAMLAVLEAKAAERGLGNIDCRVGDAHDFRPDAGFDMVCAFSALEYARDLAGLAARMASWLVPGGLLFITTARRGPLRFFAQLGNAMRQGVWLHARSEIEIGSLLSGAGLAVEQLSTFGHGMGIAAAARRPFG